MTDKNFLNNPVLDTEVEINKLRHGGIPFNRRGVIAFNAAVPIILLPKEMMEQLKVDGQVFLEGMRFLVDGATDWVGVGTGIQLRSTDGTVLVQVDVSTLSGNQSISLDTDFMTINKEIGDLLISGEGLDMVLVGAPSAGSDVVMHVWGKIK